MSYEMPEQSSYDAPANCDRPDNPRGHTLPRSDGGGYVEPSGGGPFRQNAREDSEASAIQACVEKLDDVDTTAGIHRVLSYLVNRYLDLSLEDNGR